MKILVVLNYYYPYISGVSEVARIVAEGWVEQGHKVTVITANYDHLKEKEIINGVEVLRMPVIMKISKGTISPKFILKAISLSKNYDIVNMHLPMIESGIISSLISKDKLLTTYHCDINLPHSLINNFIVKCMDISNSICLKKSKKVTVTSLDYAINSRIAYKYQKKLSETAAPPKDFQSQSIEKDTNEKIIGFCGRIVQEKGIDILIKAFEILSEKYENIKLVIGGDYTKIAGGSIYPQLKDYIKRHSVKNIQFLGMIDENKMEEFYSSLDVFVLPSVNSLEAFGIVQIEAMLCGTPVVASDLPGVRTIIQNTKMGEICRCGDERDLAEKIENILENPDKYIKSREFIEAKYGKKKIISNYTKAMEEMMS